MSGSETIPEDEPDQVDEMDSVEETDVETLVREREEFRARWQRAQADYKNLKRRSQSDFEDQARRSMVGLFDELLRVLDHLDMALACPATTDESKNLAMGVSLTRDQFVKALERERVEPIRESGRFDPEIHEVVETVEDAEREPGTIVTVVRRGYTWRYGVLRPAQVRVVAGEVPPPDLPDESEEVRAENPLESETENVEEKD